MLKLRDHLIRVVVLLLKLVKYLVVLVFLFSLNVVLASVPVILQEHPLNQSYFYNSIDWNFTVYDDSNSTFTVRGWQDDILVYEALVFPNNTQESVSHTLLSQTLGTHNMTLYAEDNGDTNTTETFYTIREYEFQVDYNEFVAETSDHDYNITIPYDSSIIDEIYSDFIYNGTNYTTETRTSNSTHFVYNRTIPIPLVNANNSQASFYFANRIEYSNGTTVFENTSTYTNNITYAYWIESFSADASNYLEGEDVDLSLYIGYSLTNANLSTNFTMIYNGTYNESYQVLSYTDSGSDYLYERTFDAGPSINNSETRTIYGNLTIQFGDNTRIVGEEDTVDVYRMSITNCTGISNTSTLLVSFFDEIDFSVTNGSIDVILFTLYSGDIERSYSFVETEENETYNYCLYPTWGDINSTVYMEYENSNSQKRPYYLVNTELSNSQSSLNVYLLNDTYSDYTNMYFYDENSDNLDGYYVRILKFNANDNVWQTLFIGRTDTSGILTTYLQPLIQPYRFYITGSSGSIFYRTESEVITCLSGSCPPYEKHVYTRGTSTDYVDLWNIEYSYDFDETTRTVTIEVSDTSGLTEEIWLSIDQVLDFNVTQEYVNQTYSSSTIYFSQVLPNTTEEYIVNVQLLQNGVYYSIISESVVMQTVARLGVMGILISILLIISFIVAGSFIGNLPGEIIGGAGGLMLSVLLRLIPMTYVGLYSIIFVILIVLIEVLRRE